MKTKNRCSVFVAIMVIIVVLGVIIIGLYNYATKIHFEAKLIRQNGIYSVDDLEKFPIINRGDEKGDAL